MDSRIEKRTILKSNQDSNMIIRWAHFVQNIFPVFPVQLSVAGRFVFPYLLVNSVFYPGQIDFLILLLGGVTMTGFTLLLRVFDELKDYEGDKINFPDRPLVVGIVSVKDLKLFSLAIIGFLSVLNFVFAPTETKVVFAVIIIFSLLIFKWFFFERAIRASLPLALVTHNPVVYLYQLYVYSFVYVKAGSFELTVLTFLLLEGMTGTAWEISRKIRVPKQETDYTTYSKIWSPRIAAGVLFGLVLISYFGCFWILFQHLSIEMSSQLFLIWLVPLVGVALLGVNLSKYLKLPSQTPKIRESLEGYIATTYVASLIFLFLA